MLQRPRCNQAVTVSKGDAKDGQREDEDGDAAEGGRAEEATAEAQSASACRRAVTGKVGEAIGWQGGGDGDGNVKAA